MSSLSGFGLAGIGNTDDFSITIKTILNFRIIMMHDIRFEQISNFLNIVRFQLAISRCFVSM